jgi:hypothetical protein
VDDCFLSFLFTHISQTIAFSHTSEKSQNCPRVYLTQLSPTEPKIFVTYAFHVSYTTRNSFITYNQPPSNLGTNNSDTLLNAPNTYQPCLQAHLTAPTPRTRVPTHPGPPPHQLVCPFPSNTRHVSNKRQPTPPVHQAYTQPRVARPGANGTASRPSSTTVGARATTQIRLRVRRMEATIAKMAPRPREEGGVLKGRDGYNGVQEELA